jgi:hypothetical protein
MNIDSMVRETLHSHADGAPPAAGLVDAARSRARRRRRRRQATATGAALLAVALVAIAPLAISREAAIQPVQPDSGSDTLVPPSYEVPPFPFTPGWIPDGLGEPYYRLGRDDWSGLEYIELVHFESGIVPSMSSPFPQFSVTVYTEDPGDEFAPIDAEPAQEAVTMRGVAATLYTGRSDETMPDEVEDNRVSALRWSDGPDRWVTVVGYNGFGDDDVIRYAEELIEEPVPGRTAFTFDLLPPDVRLSSVDLGHMNFKPAGAPTDVPGPVEMAEDLISVSLVGYRPTADAFFCEADPESGELETCPTTGPGPISVGEYDGELINDEILMVYLEAELTLVVRSRGQLALSQEDMIRFATSVHVTSDAVPIT